MNYFPIFFENKNTSNYDIEICKGDLFSVIFITFQKTIIKVFSYFENENILIEPKNELFNKIYLTSIFSEDEKFLTIAVGTLEGEFQDKFHL